MKLFDKNSPLGRTYGKMSRIQGFNALLPLILVVLFF